MQYSIAVSRRARKKHRCSWCGEWIVAGDEYVRWACFDGGSASTVKMHPECNEAGQEEAHESGEYEFMLYDHERPPEESRHGAV